MNGWTSGKDVILKLCGMLTVKGGTDKIVEYFGEGTKSFLENWKSTITNMGAELGATCSDISYDEKCLAYLKSTARAGLAAVADAPQTFIICRSSLAKILKIFWWSLWNWFNDFRAAFSGTTFSDIHSSISALAKEAQEKGWPLKLSVHWLVLARTHLNEDIGRAAYLGSRHWTMVWKWISHSW